CERPPCWEVLVGGAAGAGAEVEPVEGVPGDQHSAVTLVADRDLERAVAGLAHVREYDLPAIEQRHRGAVGRAARDGADSVETQVEITIGGATFEFVGTEPRVPAPLDEAGKVP